MLPPVWSDCSPREFLTWLSLEGQDGLIKVQADYALLPWPLRAVLWIWSNFNSTYHPVIFDLHPGDVFGDFFSSRSLGNDEYILSLRSPLQLQAAAWMSGAFDDPDDALISPQSENIQAVRLAALVAGDLETIADIETEFQAFQKDMPPWDPLSDLPTKNLSEAEWDKLYQVAGPSAEFLGHKDIPIPCLQRWRQESPQIDTRVLYASVVCPERVIPSSWLPTILNTGALLKDYLSVHDIDMSLRRRFRADANPAIRHAALSRGDFTDPELANFAPEDWASLEGHPAITLPMAQGLLRHDPGLNSLLVPQSRLA